MSSPIPTQLSPGVNVSEIDLSQFVQPQSLNSAGMVGIFNWGPGYEKNRVSTESQLVGIYGKPTLDQSDVNGNSDFLSASNFLKYSNNLNVIRALKAQDSNATSVEAGITGVESCTFRTISNLDQFKRFGGFSGDIQGIENTAHFRARYPGNFGDSLRVYVSDGNTTSSGANTNTLEFQGNFRDFTLKGGYQGLMVQGITHGTCGITFQAFVLDVSLDAEGNLIKTIVGSTGGLTGGETFASFDYYIVTFKPPSDLTPDQFIQSNIIQTDRYLSSRYDRFNFLYATGTTSENYTLTGEGKEPNGNVSKTFPLSYFNGLNNQNLSKQIVPFVQWDFEGAPNLNGFDTAQFMRADGDFVQMIFPSFDRFLTNQTYDASYGWNTNPATWKKDGNGKIILYVDITAVSGLPSIFSIVPAMFEQSVNNIVILRTPLSRFSSSLFGANFFVPTDRFHESDDPAVLFKYRFTPLQSMLDHGHLFYFYATGSEVFPPPTTVKGFATFIGLTGQHTFRHYRVFGQTGADNTITEVVDFGSIGGVTGIRNNFKNGIIQIGEVANVSGTITTTTSTTTTTSVSNFVFEKQPSTSPYAQQNGGFNDEINFAVVDQSGKFGPKGAILERFELLSKAVDAKNQDGESIYYKDFINNNSKYVYMTKVFSLTGGNATYNSKADSSFGEIYYEYNDPTGETFGQRSNYDMILRYGQSGLSAASENELLSAYSMFIDDDNAVDILFVPELYRDISENTTSGSLEANIYDRVIASRKDTILVLPTPKIISSNSSLMTNNLISFRKNEMAIPSNSYTMLVAGQKTFFDTYNNQIRKMSLSSDLAGILCAQEIPWESPAGFARGNIRNSIKLETNFTKADRDELYKNAINFFVQFNDGSGTILFSDKTLLTKPSAFDRINVRRVFIAIEKAIAKASKYSLFEFNDEFTRSQFRNLTIPFLSNIQAQRGIADFKVVCDETNNTQEVIDKNQFVADIYIKPLKSINFIQLNFVAVRSDFNLSTLE